MNLSLKELVQISRKKHTKATIAYLKERGLTKETAQKWEIGYIPDFATIKNIENYRSLGELGIVIKDFSPLEKYITFPLYDQYNNLIGLSGRTLEKEKRQRKYWHSILQKRRFLFGLNQAVTGIREKKSVIVCEGQFDVISSHQLGITNCCATMGTALTDEQVTILSRYTNVVYVVFDNDKAGLKSLEKLRENNYYELELIPIIIPFAGEDLDSYLRKYGKEAFEELLKKNTHKKDDVSIDFHIDGI